ncbi:MAG: hypothetical protein IKJ94_06380 [Oscillospiraceae bacterium]|nr:hypothetical protein [Oscillospiraceae bacterium]
MMEKTAFQQKITALFSDIVVSLNEPMAKHTSFALAVLPRLWHFPKMRKK